MEKTFIGGYWKERPENSETAATKITTFLTELQKLDALFLVLRLPHNSQKKAMSNSFEINYTNIVSELKKHHKNDMDSNGYSKIGYNLWLFNKVDDVDFTVSFTVGNNSQYLSNVCYIDVKGTILIRDLHDSIITIIRQIFEPQKIRHGINGTVSEISITKHNAIVKIWHKILAVLRR